MIDVDWCRLRKFAKFLGYFLTIQWNYIGIGIITLLCIVGVYYYKKNKEGMENKDNNPVVYKQGVKTDLKNVLKDKIATAFPSLVNKNKYPHKIELDQNLLISKLLTIKFKHYNLSIYLLAYSDVFTIFIYIL